MKTSNVYGFVKYLCLLVIIVCSSFFIYAQAGFSSGSVASNSSNGIMSSNQIIIEEYMNYHLHQINLPKDGESIAVDLRWGNNHFGKNDDFAILQAGFATQFIDDFTEIEPVNVCLVIDKSGSMSSDGRMIKLKIALNTFVEHLRPSDKISIVSYDSKASLIFPLQELRDMKKVKLVISGLEPGGSTNLNAGMVLGYEQLANELNIEEANRLILFTDGIVNTGETNIEKIIENSKSFNKLGIDISTIGVGYNFNFDLLRQLAKAGKGLNHFVGKAEDIEKVFINEVESLLAPIAKNVRVEIISDDILQIDHVFGYSPKFSDNKVSFDLDNMNSGLTQIILIKYNIEELKKIKSGDIKISLKYYDIRSKTEKEIIKSIRLNNDKMNKSNPIANKEVKKNYSIALMAQALKDMAVAFENNEKDKAKQIINDCLNIVNEYYPYLKDQDVKRVKELVVKYAGLLNKNI